MVRAAPPGRSGGRPEYVGNRTAEDRDAWPATVDWDEGPDPVRYPELYDGADQDGEHQDADLEPLDIPERTAP